MGRSVNTNLDDITVRITNVTEKRMAVIPDEDILRRRFEVKKNYEIDTLFKICQLGYTVIKQEWRPTVCCKGIGLYVTFGKMVL